MSHDRFPERCPDRAPDLGPDLIRSQSAAYRARRLARLAAACAACAMLGACGASGTAAPSTPSASAEQVVGLASVPALNRCLSGLVANLQAHAKREDIPLSCANGRYRGLTVQGLPCELKIDGDLGAFGFSAGRDSYVIAWDTVAYAPDGRAIHNLEDASVTAQPGVQMSKFSSTGLQTMTENVVLRSAPEGRPAMPMAMYQRSTEHSASTIVCRLGA
ncbi:MAG: hypothetical protein V4582_13360 [Pseudomonadota bacterium]